MSGMLINIVSVIQVEVQAGQRHSSGYRKLWIVLWKVMKYG